MCIVVFFRSICEMNLEAELFTLQDSNSKLVAALHEANANVEQWKKQLTAYQEETERLRDQVSLHRFNTHTQRAACVFTLNSDLVIMKLSAHVKCRIFPPVFANSNWGTLFLLHI